MVCFHICMYNISFVQHILVLRFAKMKAHLHPNIFYPMDTGNPVFFFLFLEKKYHTFSNMFIFWSGQITDQVMSGIPVRVYEPESSIQQPNRPVLLYLHGGGWAFLSIGKLFTIVFFSTSSTWITVMFNFKRRIDFVDNYDHLCQKLAKDANIVVISVEWVHLKKNYLHHWKLGKKFYENVLIYMFFISATDLVPRTLIPPVWMTSLALSCMYLRIQDL